MTRPDDEYPPLDVTSTLHMGSLDEVLEANESEVVPGRVPSLPPGIALLVVRRGPKRSWLIGASWLSWCTIGPQIHHEALIHHDNVAALALMCEL